MKTLVLLITTLALLVGCTENQRAKYFGGRTQVALPPGTKLVSATWKDEDLWYLFRNARPGEKPEIFTLKEESSFGLFQGEVVFVEQ